MVVKLITWLFLFQVIVLALRQVVLIREFLLYIVKLGSTIFGTDRSKILLVPFLLITVLYVQKKKTADPRSSVTKERTVFNE